MNKEEVLSINKIILQNFSLKSDEIAVKTCNQTLGQGVHLLGVVAELVISYELLMWVTTLCRTLTVYVIYNRRYLVYYFGYFFEFFSIDDKKALYVS